MQARNGKQRLNPFDGVSPLMRLVLTGLVRGWLAVVLAIGLAAGPALAQNAPAIAEQPAAPSPPPVKPEAVPATPLLWKVTPGDGATGTLWLFGTVHLLPPNIDWARGAVLQALEQSDRLVMELTPQELASPTLAMGLRDRGLLPEGRSLRGLVSAKTYAAVLAHTARMGLPEQAVERMRPWLVGVLLSVGAARQVGFEEASGVDTRLPQLPQARDKPIDGLETADQQIALFANMTDQQSADMLDDTIDQIARPSRLFANMAAAWAKGDEKRLTRLVIDRSAKFKSAFDVIFVDRNRAWTPKLETEMARGGVTFVAVGAGHMLGADGLVRLLRERGHKVEQVQPAPRGASGR
jgi:uncharacterized protein